MQAFICHCEIPVEPLSSPSVSCSICQRYFHTVCLSSSPTEPFTCAECTQRPVKRECKQCTKTIPKHKTTGYCSTACATEQMRKHLDALVAEKNVFISTSHLHSWSPSELPLFSMLDPSVVNETSIVEQGHAQDVESLNSLVEQCKGLQNHILVVNKYLFIVEAAVERARRINSICALVWPSVVNKELDANIFPTLSSVTSKGHKPLPFCGFDTRILQECERLYSAEIPPNQLEDDDLLSVAIDTHSLEPLFTESDSTIDPSKIMEAQKTLEALLSKPYFCRVQSKCAQHEGWGLIRTWEGEVAGIQAVKRLKKCRKLLQTTQEKLVRRVDFLTNPALIHSEDEDDYLDVVDMKEGEHTAQRKKGYIYC